MLTINCPEALWKCYKLPHLTVQAVVFTGKITPKNFIWTTDTVACIYAEDFILKYRKGVPNIASFYNNKENIQKPITVADSGWILRYKIVQIKKPSNVHCNHSPAATGSVDAAVVSAPGGKLIALLLSASASSLCDGEEGSEDATGVSSAGDADWWSMSVLGCVALSLTSGDTAVGNESATSDVDWLSSSSHLTTRSAAAASSSAPVSHDPMDVSGASFSSDTLRSVQQHTLQISLPYTLSTVKLTYNTQHTCANVVLLQPIFRLKCMHCFFSVTLSVFTYRLPMTGLNK